MGTPQLEKISNVILHLNTSTELGTRLGFEVHAVGALRKSAYSRTAHTSFDILAKKVTDVERLAGKL